ncbi:plastocyanin/azurin family copper-binding protein [Nocardioides sp.]|jgi:plastocyanin|uniref:plastocyanin/azurin family copper-binding protein n=1 Tax=Nocardioides sp. TaxID=35761 RepID=UPI0031FF20D9|nr:blue (type 1) copper domain protein [Nocardioides sp.]
MISRVFGAAVLAAGVSFVPLVQVGPAAAGGVAVNVHNMAFTPAKVQVPVGGTVTWTFPDKVQHTTTSTQGFWNSGAKSAGGTFSHSFASAGSYSYRCTFHSMMRGAVNVPVSASGTPSAGWRLRWSTVPGAGGTTFDVQVRRPGSSAWTPFRTDTTRATAKFNPGLNGKYAVRARTTDGQNSGWSPLRSVKIT